MRIYADFKMIWCGILLLVTSGCASVLDVDTSDPLVVNKAVEVERDTFKGIMYYRGPLVSNRGDAINNAPEVENIALYASTERSLFTRYFLSITGYYDGDWLGFDQAYDSSGKKFHALSVKHKADCHLRCGYDEVLEIEFNRKYLDDHAKTGITMRLYGPSGAVSAPFTLPSGYIQGFLTSLNASL